MKLTNPTDNELDAAFAEHVAGMKVEPSARMTAKPDDMVWAVSEEYGVYKEIPRWTKSADAVLPWLEKANQWSAVNKLTCGYWGYTVSVCIDPPTTWIGQSEVFSRACVIALLRAHGVEVEFTNA